MHWLFVLVLVIVLVIEFVSLASTGINRTGFLRTALKTENPLFAQGGKRVLFLCIPCVQSGKRWTKGRSLARHGDGALGANINACFTFRAEIRIYFCFTIHHFDGFGGASVHTGFSPPCISLNQQQLA